MQSKFLKVFYDSVKITLKRNWNVSDETIRIKYSVWLNIWFWSFCTCTISVNNIKQLWDISCLSSLSLWIPFLKILEKVTCNTFTEKFSKNFDFWRFLSVVRYEKQICYFKQTFKRHGNHKMLKEYLGFIFISM